MKSVANDLPKARTNQLVIKEVDDEILIYDLKSDQAHCLNPTAALIWQQCDGETNVKDIAAALKQQTGTGVDENVVWLGLDQLRNFDLLEVVPAKPRSMPNMTRRRMVRNAGAAALVLPVIMSIVAPTAQAQAPCVNPGGRAPGAACGSPNQCCTDVCCTTTGPCPNNTCL